jgi:PAS domain-containing protein
MNEEKSSLAVAHIQSALLSEAVRSAEVGFVVWDEDRRYVAANPAACTLLACTLDELIGASVGDRTEGGLAVVEQVVRDSGGSGQLTITRFDGRKLRVGYVSFQTRIAGVPYMGSIIWPTD